MRGRVLQIAVNAATTENPTWVTIAQATSHKFTFNNQTGDVTTKDIGKVKEVTGRSWSMSTDNLVCNYVHDATASGIHAAALLKNYVNTGAELMVRLQYAEVTAANATDEDEADNDVTVLMTGMVRVTKFDINFPNKENSSYTAEFTGKGKPSVAA